MFEHWIDDGIVLRQIEPQHAEQLFMLVDDNRHHLRQWLGWVDSTISADDTRRFIDESRAEWISGRRYQTGIWYREQLVGMIGTVAIEWQNSAIELGYWLSAAFQGRGIMTRTCRAFTTFAFDQLHLHRVQIRCASGNTRSRAIPERLGFQQEGTIREGLRLRDEFLDIVLYGMLTHEWASTSARSRLPADPPSSQ